MVHYFILYSYILVFNKKLHILVGNILKKICSCPGVMGLFIFVGNECSSVGPVNKIYLVNL